MHGAIQEERSNLEPFATLFGRHARVAAALVLAASFVIPPYGFGFSICLFQYLTGLPCFACGLTRSVACLSRLDAHSSLLFHPFGVAVYLWAWVAVGLSAAGPLRRHALAKLAAPYRSAAVAALVTLAFAFCAFGTARLYSASRTRGGAPHASDMAVGRESASH